MGQRFYWVSLVIFSRQKRMIMFYDRTGLDPLEPRGQAADHRLGATYLSASAVSMVLLPSLVAIMPMSAEATFRKNASVSIEAAHDTNASLGEVDNSNSSYTFGGRFQLNQNSARFSTNIDLSLSRELNQDFDSRTLPSGSLATQWTISQNRLFWTLNNNISQVLDNSLSFSTIENSDLTNVFSTGPTWVIPFSTLTSLRLSANHQRIDYDNSGQEDRQRNSASVFLGHTFTKLWSGDVSRSANWEEFTLGTTKVVTDQVGLSFRGKRISWRAAGGETQVEDGQLSTDTQSFSFQYRLSTTVSVFANYSEGLDSDIGQSLAFANRRASDIAFLSNQCFVGLATAGGTCNNLPGVTVGLADDGSVTYTRDRDQSRITQNQFNQSFLEIIDNTDALFESERTSAGIQIALNRASLSLSVQESEDRQSIELNTLVFDNDPDIVRSKSATVALNFPLSARIGASVSYVRRQPESDTLLLQSIAQEDRLSCNLTWAIEPMLQGFFRFAHTDVERSDLDSTGAVIANSETEADGQRFAIGFTYNFQ